ncbi:hypothetical protein HKBW3S43_00347 [Candidatus Hakubella thermalkaliphila]|uniref:Uncharacterized protein n=1 Tax=Candidatus Hakubella thermalkaliphila TaxID=2754717 RepID=A0A6V8PRW9_9ACTN|nr:hypothetical protein [Candidatus Hakubella thermalkaliphila]MBT9170517.1 hypothetical protein [Actinomycetota bacterium]GFP26648.1 hypothetical protein HKBW3S33_00063 [Candidatus Hakubella thermalkaliphila]GFP34554.1 hypothetical protein HKBW3S43_00347 [Candidatus Hakubella thermalkaliphila]GFP37736.1 hypothetical protein HKBW3S44_01413 [Candidatus Hakubella thermalkaliphila]GFP39683.1 hypothetical protein HKBW3S47_01381 [Candidatus Hakubella thermalkaliphila]
MTDQVTTIIESFVRRGLFASPEQAVVEMARDYILHQVERYRAIAEHLQSKYAMTYEQFEAYLKSRSATVAATPNPVLNQAVMTEEEDALDWKIAREMLQAWLGLEAEVGA